MLRTVDSLIQRFRKTESETLEKHAYEIETMLKHIQIISVFSQASIDYLNYLESSKSNHPFRKKFGTSLTLGSECELVRISAYTLFLTLNALYRSAKENIRYMLESILQSTYIDINHPNSSIYTKWEILKEIENKREYRSANLINSWKTLDHKDDLQKEYKLLSGEVHPSHAHAKDIFKDVMVETYIPAKVDRNEILKISNSLLRLYDIFYFLVVSCFPEFKEVFVKNKEIQKIIKELDFRLLQISLTKKMMK